MIGKFSRQLSLMAAVGVVGCASIPVKENRQAVDGLANHDSPHLHGPAACQKAIAAPASEAAALLSQGSIELFVWNIKKGSHPDALADLARLAGDKDLVLIQEAQLEQQPVDVLETARYWSFAPGFTTATASTGVMTISRVAPLTHCHLSDRERWLRTRKAVSITRFGLPSSDETLAVVNVHAVNFTLGLADFDRQIAKIEAILAEHHGPVILAGDFNTWRQRRFEILKAAADRLELDELSFKVDNRARPLGQAVDHIFVRGLDAGGASSDLVDTSDHSPMSVTLRL